MEDLEKAGGVYVRVPPPAAAVLARKLGMGQVWRLTWIKGVLVVKALKKREKGKRHRTHRD